MSIEGLAALGVLVFLFIAAAHLFTTTRGVKRQMRRRPLPSRKLIASPNLAQQMADTLVADALSQHPELVAAAKEAGRITDELEEVLDEPLAHYTARVLPKFKFLFHQTVERRILGAEDAPE
ncbi:MAG: hypothetical protein M0R76_08935 [Proteobacteria bacterium]|nr:hypothetical protein [Pseudomonadota bacterium]